MVLATVFSILWNFYSVLWIGEPIALTCQNIDSIRVDCTLKHRALVRESGQQVRDVQGVKVDPHTSSSESGDTTKYWVSLKSQQGDRFIKEYSYQNDSEIKALQRLNQFVENPEKHLTIPLQYNLWKPIITFLFLLPFVLGIFVFLLSLAIQLIQPILIAIKKTLKVINVW